MSKKEVSFMKRLMVIILIVIMAAGLSGCNSGGVTKEEYNRVTEELNNLKNIENNSDKVSKEEYDNLIEELNKLKNSDNDLTDKPDKKIPDVMIVKLPNFLALVSQYEGINGVFGNNNLMDWMGNHSYLEKSVIFNCADFLCRSSDGKFRWLYAVNESISEIDTAQYEVIEFEGGLYALAVCIDGDDGSRIKVENKIMKWLEGTNFEYDTERDIMGNMPFLYDEIKDGLGYEQLLRYVPIKLKENN